MNISDIMTTDVFTLRQDDTILHAAKIMKENDLGFIPVTENKRVMGVVTDRDLVIRGYAEGLNADTAVKQVMTKSCITCEQNISVEEAADIMAKNQIRRLCITSSGELAGVCALGDISLCIAGMKDAGDALSQISQQSYN